jgi:peptide/nickel transport system ATP-binding protein
MSIRVENLSVAYATLAGDCCAVDDVSFTVADGEIMGLAGESGCGKSTLGTSLIYLDGRMRLRGGRVELDGIQLPISDTKAMRPYRMKEISLVPQYAMSALNPTRKVNRLIADLLKCHGVRYADAEQEIRRRIGLVGLGEDVLGRYPFELSGGMRQRVTLVLSTLLNPSLLIADEITSALDVSTQRAVGEMLMAFRDRDFVKSVIAITHDLSILAQIADSILVMYAGRLVEKADTDTIVNAPLHPYTKALLASLPVVGMRYEKTTLTGIPGRPPTLLHPPAGCRFAERCPFATRRCAEQPPFQELRPGHSVACWKVTEEAAAHGSPEGRGVLAGGTS